MLKIGDFSRLCQVPVKTLRHYDEVGLLKPVHVDAVNGYRYYAVDQLPRLNRLLALKEIGFSLEQIGRILNDGVTHEQLRGMLMLKRAEAEGRLNEEHERLTRIEARLRAIEREDYMPNYDVTLKTVQPLLVASCRVEIPTNDMVPEVLGDAYRRTYEHVKAHGGKALDPCIALWHTTADTHEDEDAEAIVPIERSIPEGDGIKVHELPGGSFASAVHHGVFAEFTQLHPALLRWIDANGYRVAGPSREVYLSNNDRENSVTEVQYPVEKA